MSLFICTFFETEGEKRNRSDGKLIKKENTLSEIVAKLKCGSYIWGAKDDAVCNSAFACVKKEKPKAYEHISAHIWDFWGFLGKESFTQEGTLINMIL